MSSFLFSSLTSALKKVPAQSSPASSSAEGRNEPDIPWKVVGSANEHLLREIRKIYWDGVKRELAHILLTLREWQQPKYSKVILEDEEDDFIHGYDTFLDQVSYHSRLFAQQYGKLVIAFDFAARSPEFLVVYSTVYLFEINIGGELT
jgi:hypothetical protein